MLPTLMRGGVLSLGGLAALQLAMSMVFQLVVLSVVGAGGLTDAYLAAQAIPLVLHAVVALSYQAVWQPALSVASADPGRWLRLQKAAQGQVVVSVGGTSLLLALSASWWVPWLFPGFDAQQVGLVISMLDWLLVAGVFNAQAAMYQCALRARGRFLLPELVILLGVCVAATALLPALPAWGIESVAWISAARAIVVASTMYFMAARPLPSIRAAVQELGIWRKLLPLLGASTLYKTGPLIDRYWSSQAPAGGLTVFSFAQMGVGAIATVLERALSMPAGPRLARLMEAGEFHQARRLYRRSLRNVGFASAACTAGILLLQPVWASLLGTALDIQGDLAHDLWLVFVLLAGYLYVAAAGTVVTAAFYAAGDTRTPAAVGVVGFFAGVLFKSAGFVMLGLPGLAAGTSLYYALNISILIVMLERRFRGRLSS